MDNFLLLLIGFLVLMILAFIGLATYVFINRYRIIEDISSHLIEFVVNNEQNQKAMYQIGGIIGSGVKGGVGLDLPRGGKFKWQDALIQLATQFLTQGIKNPSSLPTGSPIPSPSEGLNALKNKDVW